jgi:hypothetical protein
VGGIPHGATQNNLRDEFSKVGEAQGAGVDGMCHAIAMWHQVAPRCTKMHQDMEQLELGFANSRCRIWNFAPHVLTKVNFSLSAYGYDM